MPETHQEPTNNSMPRAPQLLGYAGLIPFIGLSLASIMFEGEGAQVAVIGLNLYAAVILSFLGGLHWGRIAGRADAFEGGKQAVAESYRNLCATGATPLAVTNNLNFGNPERPEIMAQIVGSVKGMGEACQMLGTPVVSGNVSLYNETDGEAIFPCPVIGMVGTIADVKKAIGTGLTEAGHSLYMVGKSAEGGWLGASLLAEALGYENANAPPPVSLADEAKHGQFIANAVNQSVIQAAHDISDGGLLVAVAEMALKGQKGADLSVSDDLGTLFGEDQGRYVVVTSDPTAFEAAASDANVPVSKIGHITNADDDGFGTLTVGHSATISMKEIFEANEALLPKIASA